MIFVIPLYSGDNNWSSSRPRDRINGGRCDRWNYRGQNVVKERWRRIIKRGRLSRKQEILITKYFGKKNVIREGNCLERRIRQEKGNKMDFIN